MQRKPCRRAATYLYEVKNHHTSQHQQQKRKESIKSHIRLKFRDTGQGIAPEILTRIFDPFYTTKPSKIHSGLGLAVVDGLLQTTGGRIRVDSNPARGQPSRSICRRQRFLGDF